MIIIEDILTNDLDIIPKYTKITVIENLSKKEPYLLKSLSDYDNKEEIIDWISQTDPVAVKSRNKKTPFVNQILDWFLNGKIRLPEDIETTKEALKIYNKAKQLGDTPNVSEFNSPGDILRKFKEEKEGSDYDNVAKLVGTDGEYKMYRIDNWDEGKVCFADSGWCVRNENFFNEYQPPYYMVTKGKKRYALMHPDAHQVKDVYDNSLTYEKAKPIEKFIKMLWPKWPEQVDDYDLLSIAKIWPEAEPSIMKNPWHAYDYAKNIIKGR